MRAPTSMPCATYRLTVHVMHAVCDSSSAPRDPTSCPVALVVVIVITYIYCKSTGAKQPAKRPLMQNQQGSNRGATEGSGYPSMLNDNSQHPGTELTPASERSRGIVGSI